MTYTELDDHELDQLRREVVARAGEQCDQRFPLRYRNAVTDRPDVLAWAANFHAKPATAPSLLLLGPTGTGKTWQAYAALRHAVCVALPTRSGTFRAPRWEAKSYADLIADLRPGGRDHDPEARLQRYLSVELLLVDDLGAGKLTEFTEEATYRLINGRYNEMRPSIFTTNLPIGQLKEAVGDRIASRLAEICERVVLDGPDKRRLPADQRPAPPQPPDQLVPDPPERMWWEN